MLKLVLVLICIFVTLTFANNVENMEASSLIPIDSDKLKDVDNVLPMNKEIKRGILKLRRKLMKNKQLREMKRKAQKQSVHEGAKILKDMLEKTSAISIESNNKMKIRHPEKVKRMVESLKMRTTIMSKNSRLTGINSCDALNILMKIGNFVKQNSKST